MAFNLRRSISELTADSIPGVYYLFNPISLPGRLISRIVPPVRYLSMGTAWALNTKHKGTANDNRRTLSNTHSHTEFAAAGQDAIAVVIPSTTLWKGCKLKEINLQITAFPRPSSAILLADAAAIKVGLRLS